MHIYTPAKVEITVALGSGAEHYYFVALCAAATRGLWGVKNLSSHTMGQSIDHNKRVTCLIGSYFFVTKKAPTTVLSVAFLCR